VLEAYVAAIPALVFFGVFAGAAAARAAADHEGCSRAASAPTAAGSRSSIAVLAAAIVVNVIAQLNHGSVLDRLPAIGIGVWLALLGCAPLVLRLERAAVGDARRQSFSSASCCRHR
jgi:hypothetical protein